MKEKETILFPLMRQIMRVKGLRKLVNYMVSFLPSKWSYLKGLISGWLVSLSFQLVGFGRIGLSNEIYISINGS